MSDNEHDDTMSALAGIVSSAEVVDLDEAREERNSQAAASEADKAAAPGGEGSPPQTVNKYGLPDGCPVVPLGKLGQRYYYLDACNQLVDLSARDHSRNNLMGIFSPFTGKATALWPRRKQNDEGEWYITGFKADECADALMDACARVGVWDPAKRVRERGAWCDEDGSLIFHCGKMLWTARGEIAPTKIGEHIYPTADALPTPCAEREPSASEGGAGQELLDLLKTWNWKRCDIDATLLLGWIGAAFVGGALDWRPMVFLTGDRETGKSTLQKKVIAPLFNGGIISTSDCTARGLAQYIGLSSLPVAIDELENAADSRKQKAVIELARQASSGDIQLRGTADHGGVAFQARSCFLFSAILMPPLEAQDRSRMAILRLNPFQKGGTPPELEPKTMRVMGRRLMRRMFDQWGRYGETEWAYKLMLREAGHTNRACDQFGALLACADLLLFNQLPDRDSLDEWAARLKPEDVREVADNKTNAELCLDYLGQAVPDYYRSGARKTVAELVLRVADDRALGEESVAAAEAALTAGGLRVVALKRQLGRKYLAVPDTHRLVGDLFEGSAWQGAPGGAGGWSEALGRLDGTVAGHNTRIAGKQNKCTLIPVELVADFEGEREENETATQEETV